MTLFYYTYKYDNKNIENQFINAVLYDFVLYTISKMQQIQLIVPVNFDDGVWPY